MNYCSQLVMCVPFRSQVMELRGVDMFNRRRWTWRKNSGDFSAPTGVRTARRGPAPTSSGRRAGTSRASTSAGCGGGSSTTPDSKDRRHQPRDGHTDRGVARRPSRPLAVLGLARTPQEGSPRSGPFGYGRTVARTRGSNGAAVKSCTPGRGANSWCANQKARPGHDATRR